MTTIKLRIRVGVTADGTWIAFNSNHGDAVNMETQEATAQRMISDAGPIVAWHWITAEVPMPEVEQGEVAGEVER